MSHSSILETAIRAHDKSREARRMVITDSKIEARGIDPIIFPLPPSCKRIQEEYREEEKISCIKNLNPVSFAQYLFSPSHMLAIPADVSVELTAVLKELQDAVTALQAVETSDTAKAETTAKDSSAA